MNEFLTFWQSQEVDKMASKKLKATDAMKRSGNEEEVMDVDADTQAQQQLQTDGDVVMTEGAQRGPDAMVFTTVENLEFTPGELDIEQLR